MTTLLHVIWGLEAGGKERFLVGLVRGLDARRFRNVVVTLRARGPFFDALRTEGCDVRCLGKRPGVDPAAWRTLRREVRAVQPDLVHTQDFTSAFAVRAAMFPGTSPPMVMTLHGGQVDLPWGKRLLHDHLLRHAAAVTAVSRQMTQALQARLGDRITIEHVPPGIDLDNVRRPNPDPEVRRALGLPADAPLIVSVMRFQAPKDPEVIIRAAWRVTQHHPECRFVLVGDGPQRSDVRALVQDLELEANILLPGYRADVPALLAHADICVLASRREGLPLSILESMAAGKPVVATHVGGVGELVEDGVTGALVPLGSDTAMAEKIQWLLDNPAARRARGQAGLERVRAHFQERTMIAAFEALYARHHGMTGISPGSAPAQRSAP